MRTGKQGASLALAAAFGIAISFGPHAEAAPGGGPSGLLRLEHTGLTTGHHVILTTSGGRERDNYMLMFDWEPGNLPLPGGAWLGLAFSSGFRILDTDFFASDGKVQLACYIPHDPSVIGVPFHLQSVAWDSANQRILTSNRVDAALEAGRPDYIPSWGNRMPTQVIPFAYDPTRSSTDNGAMLAARINSLEPGDMLIVGAGTYSINSRFNIQRQGTANDPIWVFAAPGPRPIITRPDEWQNVINIGDGTEARFLALRGFEITGGSDGIKMYKCNNVWIDSCEIHHTDGTGMAANSANTEQLYLTRNTIHDTAGYGEGMYLGANNGVYVTKFSVIAQNHIYNTRNTDQGDGIELKQGSYGNLIAENYVHDTRYPCILVYGTDGRAVNIIEGNICIGSLDNTMQVQGEAIVRNNLIINGANMGLESHDHQGQTRDLVVVHNTIINEGRATELSQWNNRPGMVFANNIVYSRDENALHFSTGSNGVAMAGNVIVGNVQGATTGFIRGNGLTDFMDVTWDGVRHDARPRPSSPFIGAGNMSHAVHCDITGAVRVMPLEPGCYDAQQQ